MRDKNSTFPRQKIIAFVTDKGNVVWYLSTVLIPLCSGRFSTDGDEFFLRIRELCQAPILILGEEQKEPAGIDLLEMGADAYLTSPLNVRELLARVRSLLRRTQASATESRGG